MSDFPLVSCLCITKNKVDLLKRSIDCFRAQSYPNKELIIVKQGEDCLISNYLNMLKDDDIYFIQLPSDPLFTLGDLRNFSIENCNGDYFCVWDDDDWQHIDRLKIQVDFTLRSLHEVSAMTNLLAFNNVTKQTYFTSFRLWEGTLLCKREIFLNGLKYPSLDRSEDNGFLGLLLEHKRIYPIVNSMLYVYVYHGRNTWDIDHFNNNIFRQQLSESASMTMDKILSFNNDPTYASRMLEASSIPMEINHFYGR